MHATRVKLKDMTEERLDANYYAPIYLANAASLAACGFPLHKIGSIAARCNCGATPKQVEYESRGIGLIRTADVRPNLFGTESVLRTTAIELKPGSSVEARPGDMVYTMSGTIGYASVIPFYGEKYSFSNTIARVRLPQDSPHDIHYVSTFFNSKRGFKQSLRLVSGGIQGHVMPNPFKKLQVPCPRKKAQIYIGNKIRVAENFRQIARVLEERVAAKFHFLTSNLLTSKKAWWASSSDVDAYRINAPNYDAVVLDMLEKARSGTGLVSLRSIIGSRGLGGGATPLGADYPSDGVFFVRVQNVKPYRLDLSDAAYIDSATDEELKRSRCAEGDVILSITGYPGTASIVLAEDLPVNINQHSVRFDIDGDLSPEFVTAALNSPFLKRQVDRLAIGGTREALDFTSVGSLQIPVLPEADRDEITAWVSTSNKCVREATRLTTASKFFVEALIDGKVTEAELVAAQDALDCGDHSADRALLSRLTRKGLDVPGEPPLFPDLDALYALLEETLTDEAQ